MTFPTLTSFGAAFAFVATAATVLGGCRSDGRLGSGKRATE